MANNKNLKDELSNKDNNPGINNARLVLALFFWLDRQCWSVWEWNNLHLMLEIPV